MDSESIIRRLHDDVINSDKLDLLDELIGPTYVNHGPFPPSVRDREDLKRFYLVRELGFPDVQVTIEDILSAGDRVAYRTTIRGTNTGEFMGLPPSGAKVTVTAMHVARIRDGQIVEHWGVLDTIDILRQLGAWPPTTGSSARSQTGS